jgi:hypothetical protein
VLEFAVVRLFFPWILALSALALAQQNNQQPPPPQQDQNANQNSSQQQTSQPLFKGKLGYKSSSTSKESTTLGFNGIDPSGKVDQKMLATSATATDQQKVKQMTANQPSPADVKAFVQQGGLNSK